MTNREEELKERLFRSASPALTDSEILELLFMSALSLEHARKVSEALVTEFRNLRRVLNASTADLSRVAGVDSRITKLIRVAAHVVSRCAEAAALEADMLVTSRDIERFLLSRFSGLKKEKALLIFFSKQGLVLGEVFIGAGTVDQVLFFPRQIMERALEFNATSLIVAHNHLHGPPLPSAKDREEAERLREILNPFDITLKDSIIVGQNRCFSIFGNAPL